MKTKYNSLDVSKALVTWFAKGMGGKFVRLDRNKPAFKQLMRDRCVERVYKTVKNGGFNESRNVD